MQIRSLLVKQQKFTYGGLEVDEAEGADHDDDASDKNVCEWTGCSPFSEEVEGFGETAH